MFGYSNVMPGQEYLAKKAAGIVMPTITPIEEARATINARIFSIDQSGQSGLTVEPKRDYTALIWGAAILGGGGLLLYALLRK